MVYLTPTGWTGIPLDPKLWNPPESEPPKYWCKVLEPLERFSGFQCRKYGTWSLPDLGMPMGWPSTPK